MYPEVKFRAKRIDNGELVYGSLLASNFIATRVKIINDNMLSDFAGCFVDPNTVGQLLMYDKNGHELYSTADYVKVTSPNDGNVFKGKLLTNSIYGISVDNKGLIVDMILYNYELDSSIIEFDYTKFK